MQSFRQRLQDQVLAIADEAIRNDDPIWRPLPSREIGRRLGVSVQVLANWRVRDLGPRAHSGRKGQGNKTFYRMDEVLEWLSGRESWEFDKDWLVARGLAPADAERGYVEWASSLLP